MKTYINGLEVTHKEFSKYIAKNTNSESAELKYAEAINIMDTLEMGSAVTLNGNILTVDYGEEDLW